MTHDVGSPIEIEDGWYAECSCGWDYLGDSYEQAEEMVDAHSQKDDEPVQSTQAAYTATTSISYTSANVTNGNISYYNV